MPPAPKTLVLQCFGTRWRRDPWLNPINFLNCRLAGLLTFISFLTQVQRKITAELEVGGGKLKHYRKEHSVHRHRLRHRNFQRGLRAIGLYEFQGKFVQTQVQKENHSRVGGWGWKNETLQRRAKKAHKLLTHKLFLPPFVPGFVPGVK